MTTLTMTQFRKLQEQANGGKKKGERKYKNQPKAYKDVMYDSSAEARYAQQLDLLLYAKEITAWDRQVEIELKGEHGSMVCKALVDFKVTHTDGSTEYVEVKGRPTKDWAIKWKLLLDKFKDVQGVRLSVARRSGKTFSKSSGPGASHILSSGNRTTALPASLPDGTAERSCSTPSEGKKSRARQQHVSDCSNGKDVPSSMQTTSTQS